MALHAMLLRVAARSLLFVSWNIDGLSRTLAVDGPRARKREVLHRSRLHELHETLGSPDVLCLQEVRIRHDDTASIEAMQNALPGFACGFSLCRDPRNARFRGGRTYGVATYVRQALTPYWLPSPDWDREGRLHLFTLPVLRLLVANVYAVNGTEKPYFDPDHGHPLGDRFAFKLHFQQQLMEHLQQVRGANQLLLLGDWNVSRATIDTHPRLRTEAPHSAARRMLNDSFMPALDVVDAFRELHPSAREYTWFNRVAARYGRLDAARVDYALLSRPLLERVEKAEVAQEQALALGSDHAPVRLTLQVGH
jgi:exodeoxyribonuclease III